MYSGYWYQSRINSRTGLSELVGRLFGQQSHRAAVARGTAIGRRHLRVESLESRCLLATDTLAAGLPLDNLPTDQASHSQDDLIVLADEVLPGWTIMREIRPAHRLASQLSAVEQAAMSISGGTSSLTASPGASMNVGTSPTITLKKGPELLANSAASAAFDQAAAILSGLFTDPIEVVIDANLANLGPNILGSTGSEEFFGDFDLLRDLLVADADPISEAIVADLPTGATFDAVLPSAAPRFTLSGDLTATRASLLAAGVAPSEFVGGADSAFDPGVPRDMDITFSSTFPFDFDRSDGITAGTFDFVGVALHEMIHGLGFVSNVDLVDSLLDASPLFSRSVEPSTLDLFRLAPGDGAADFTGATRILDPNIAEQVFYDGGVHDFTATGFAGITVGDIPLSTGVSHGDGRQASHWKDNVSIGGINIGIMDPTVLGKGVQINIASTDIRALGLIGWDVATNSVIPTVTGVSASTTDGSFGVGSMIDIDVTFDNTIVVDTSGGTPTLELETGAVDRTAVFTGVSGNVLTFQYTVQPGDTSADLDYTSPTALARNGSTIQSTTGDNADLTLPIPGTTGSLQSNQDLVIDTTPVRVIAVVRNGGNERFDQLTSLAFSFDEDVSVSLDKLDLSLLNTSTGVPVDLAATSVAWDSVTLTATWDLSGATIEVGFHTATLGAAGISDGAGNLLDGNGDLAAGDDFVTLPGSLLVALPGDTDLDGDLDADDIQLILAANKFGQGDINASWSDGDFDGDGDVDADDILLVLATGKFGTGSYAASASSGSGSLFAATATPIAPIEASAPGVSMPLRGVPISQAAISAPVMVAAPAGVSPVALTSDSAALPGALHTFSLTSITAEPTGQMHILQGVWSRLPSARATAVDATADVWHRNEILADRVERLRATDVILAPTISGDEPDDRFDGNVLAARLDGHLVDAVWDDALLSLVDDAARSR